MKTIKNLVLAFLLCMIAIPSMASNSSTNHDNKYKKQVKYTKAKPITITAVYDFSTYPNVWGHFSTTGALCIYGSASARFWDYDRGCFTKGTVELCTEYGTITIKEKINLRTYCGTWEILCGTGKYEGIKGHGTLTRAYCTETLCGVVYLVKDKNNHYGDRD